MKHHLNYSKEDPNYILLGKIFKIIGSRKSKTIMSSKGVKNVNMMILSVKVIFTAIFFYTTVEFVVRELKRDKRLINFLKFLMFQMLFKFQNFYQDVNPIHALKS